MDIRAVSLYDWLQCRKLFSCALNFTVVTQRDLSLPTMTRSQAVDCVLPHSRLSSNWRLLLYSADAYQVICGVDEESE